MSLFTVPKLHPVLTSVWFKTKVVEGDAPSCDGSVVRPGSGPSCDGTKSAGVPTWKGMRGVVAAHRSSSRLDEGRSDWGVEEVAECNSETTPPQKEAYGVIG